MRRTKLLFCVPLLVVACSNDDEPSGNQSNGGQSGTQTSTSLGGGTATGGNGGSSATLSTSGGSSNGNGGTSGSFGGSSNGNGGTSGTSGTSGGSSGITETCLGVRLVGRHDDCTEDGVRFSWSGTGFVGSFTGTGISVRLSESGSSAYYSVLIDGNLDRTLITNSGPGSYVLGTGLAAGSHRVELYRRTEASLGTTTLLGVDVEGGKLETPPAAPAYSIEVVGDSISCGYGIEGKSASCSFTPETENHYETFGAIVARAFDADLFTVAWSGMGVVVNYGGDKSSERITQRYERAIGDEATSVWHFNVKPRAVIVNLGTNDYSATSAWTDAEFVSTYANLLTTIRGHYPDAYILCTIGPMLTDAELPGARANVKAAVSNRVTAGDDQIEAYDLQAVNDNPGCDWHPSIATHQAMADELVTELKARLGW